MNPPTAPPKRQSLRRFIRDLNAAGLPHRDIAGIVAGAVHWGKFHPDLPDWIAAAAVNQPPPCPEFLAALMTSAADLVDSVLLDDIVGIA